LFCADRRALPMCKTTPFPGKLDLIEAKKRQRFCPKHRLVPDTHPVRAWKAAVSPAARRSRVPGRRTGRQINRSENAMCRICGSLSCDHLNPLLLCSVAGQVKETVAVERRRVALFVPGRHGVPFTFTPSRPDQVNLPIFRASFASREACAVAECGESSLT
jgi:hypothetical protein